MTVTVYAPGLTVEVFDRPVVPPPPPPPSSGLTTWTKLGANGGAYNAYFRRPVVLPNGDIWAAWGANSQADRGSMIFSRATNTWAKTNTLAGAGYDIGARENYGACYGVDCVWVGPGAPVGYNLLGDQRFDPATGTYTEVYVPGTGGGDGCLTYHAGYLHAVGGWSGNPPVRRSLTTGVVSALGGTTPPCTRQSQYGPAEEESPRLSYARGGIDARNGTRWLLANDNELWLCTANGTYAKATTTGDKPDTLGIVATLVEGANSIVAWCGYTGMVGAAIGAVRRQTWILDLTTLVWRKGPGLAAGDAVPTARVMSQSNLLSDGTSALLVLDSQSLTEVWRLS